MSRFAQIAAPVALSLLATAQSFAANFGTILYTPQHPQLQLTCYTRVHFTATNSQLYSRKCDSGEKPLSVKDIYVG